VLHVGFALL